MSPKRRIANEYMECKLKLPCNAFLYNHEDGCYQKSGKQQVLVGTQRTQYFCLAGGDEDSTAAVDHSLEAPQKVNVELPSDPAIPLPRELKKMSTHNFVRNVHSSIIHKIKQGQQLSVQGQMVDKQCGTSFSLKQGRIVMMTS